MQITDFSGNLTGFGFTLVLVAGALTLLNIITCIVLIWAGTLYIDKARGVSVKELREQRDRATTRERRQENDDRMRRPGQPPERQGRIRSAQVGK